MILFFSFQVFCIVMSRFHRVFSRSLSGSAVTARFGPWRSTARLQPTQTSSAITRCYSSNDRKEPSWSDLAKGAAYLVRDTVHKVGTAVSNVVSGILPGRRREEEIRERGPSPAGLQACKTCHSTCEPVVSVNVPSSSPCSYARHRQAALWPRAFWKAYGWCDFIGDIVCCAADEEGG